MQPSDSRLLSNLLKTEKDSALSLSTTTDLFHISISALQAYAAASPPPTSHVIVAVSSCLANADDALRAYSKALENWRMKLQSLKELEDEVGNVMRDREVLVTKLIKVTKTKSQSTSSLPGSPSSSFSRPAGSKLLAAQSELQGCEAHLATKERDLAKARIEFVREGLKTRLTALAECGWIWNQMGRQGLNELRGFEDARDDNGSQYSPIKTKFFKPLPNPASTSTAAGATSLALPDPPSGSDISSIFPSQSASQLAFLRPDSRPQSYDGHGQRPYLGRLSRDSRDMDFPLPQPMQERHHPYLPSALHPPPPGPPDSSSEDLHEGQYEVKENPAFSIRNPKNSKHQQQQQQKQSGTGTGTVTAGDHFRFSSLASRKAGLASTPSLTTKNKRGSTSSTGSRFTFGGLTSIFRRKKDKKDDSSSSDDDEPGSAPHSYPSFVETPSMRQRRVSLPTKMPAETTVGKAGGARLTKSPSTNKRPESAQLVLIKSGTGSQSEVGTSTSKPKKKKSKRLSNSALGRIESTTPAEPSTGTSRPSAALSRSKTTTGAGSSPSMLQNGGHDSVSSSANPTPTTATRRPARHHSLDSSRIDGLPPSSSSRGSRGLFESGQPSLLTVVEGTERNSLHLDDLVTVSKIEFPRPMSMPERLSDRIDRSPSPSSPALGGQEEEPTRWALNPHLPPDLQDTRHNGVVVNGTNGMNGTPPERRSSHRRDAVPLKSALRNSSPSGNSRNASPAKEPLSVSVSASPSANSTLLSSSGSTTTTIIPASPGSSIPITVSVTAPPTTGPTASRAREMQISESEDATSDYETGQENYTDDSDDAPPTPPPASEKSSLLASPQTPKATLMPVTPPNHTPNHNHNHMDGDESISSHSTETDKPYTRKSVRMSLPPTTFSASPSSVVDDDEEVWTPPRLAPYKSRLEPPVDAWQDSSDDEDDYSKARDALNKLDAQ